MSVYFGPFVPESKDELKKHIQRVLADQGPSVDLNYIDVLRVTNMDGLFMFSRFNGNIARWNVSNVDSMVEMFYECAFNGDISDWDTSRVENMANMFPKSAFTGDISKWNTGAVKNFYEMFLDGAFAGDISQWIMEPTNVGRLSRMFSDAQTRRLTHPNLYCWAASINERAEMRLNPPWQSHVDAMRPMLAG